MTEPSHTATELFRRVRSGSDGALQELFPLVYEELRVLARRYIRREYGNPSLQSTDLVNQAYLRLFPDQQLHWNDKAHFLAIAARSMRQILVEHARARKAVKRGGPEAQFVTLQDELLGRAEETVDVLALEEALEALVELDARQAELVVLRFYGGLTVEETAEVLNVSAATVKREWAFARTWLRNRLAS